MAKISFESWRQTAIFHNPLKNGQLDTQEIEVRIDPLTGHQSTFNPALEGKISILFPDTDYAYLEERAEATQGQCFMCDGRWRTATPTYSTDILPGGRLQRGEAVLFPNLFPLAAFHAVVILGDRHFRLPNEISADLLEDAFAISVEYFRECHRYNPSVRYFTINANFLLPAGASVMHPHLQLLGSPFPGTHHQLLLEKSLAYYEANGSCYWTDLAKEEIERGERMITRMSDSTWFTAYAPVGANETDAVWTETSHFLEWGTAEIRQMAEGIAGVLRGYHDMKFSTYNFSCFSGPVDRSSPEFRCFLRLVNRQNAMPHHRTDDYYFQKLLKNEIIIQRPEKLATFLRRYF
ncbi:hypothetical protein [Desulforhabdus amnigena]|jgi:galactose-1-phosphate uridylyltransferase|uniref:Galactose-1-phosphate uridylyltransferase n=1 Tax=Desulforhabdus amnigena TaxID=40218 RepID=A0A9W6FVB7_9BACT|nr:hypothetical protein [Desulforhabdus amnigena]NLJ26536.1 hypothetical protein [Deltaproteobacteria bacterium]GLI35571.1 hypothetical protein DAMNIGENAA_30040 [Desulforhabdus amnigena]